MIGLCHGAVDWADSALIFPWRIRLRRSGNIHTCNTMWTDQVIFMYLGLYIHISASVNIYVTTINEVEMNSREMFTGKLKRED